MLEYQGLEDRGFLSRLAALEPAVLRGALISVFAALGLLGLEWATEANAVTIATAVGALLPLLTGLLIRSGVTPNAKVAADEEDDGGFQAGEAAPFPTGTPVEVVPEDSPKTSGFVGQHRDDVFLDEDGNEIQR